MKKVVLLFLFCFLAMLGYSQCNCTVLFPLSNQYEIVDSDTVGDFAVIKMIDTGDVFMNNIFVNFTKTFTREYKPVKIPFRVINHSDAPLAFTKVNWASEVIATKYSREAVLKGDTLKAGYVTLSRLSRRYGPFTKSSTVVTNQCRWVVYFRGIVQFPPRKKD